MISHSVLRFNLPGGNTESVSGYGDLTRCVIKSLETHAMRGVSRKLTICCDLSIYPGSALAITRRSIVNEIVVAHDDGQLIGQGEWRSAKRENLDFFAGGG